MTTQPKTSVLCGLIGAGIQGSRTPAMHEREGAAQGLNAVAVQNPLTSLEDDVAFAHRIINAQTGPVVLVGHSWGGSVITQAGGHDKVKALVYVAAFAPSLNTTPVVDTKDFPAPPGFAHFITDAEGYLTLPADAIARDFAQDVSAEEARRLAEGVAVRFAHELVADDTDVEGPSHSRAIPSCCSRHARRRPATAGSVSTPRRYARFTRFSTHSSSASAPNARW